jgi:predicted nucleotidyltransferase
VIPKPAREFSDGAEELLGDNLLAVILVGSFARGDQTEGSDIDLFVLVKQVDFSLLRTIGDFVSGISTPNEINPAIVSLSEIRAHPDWFEVHKLHHDGVTLSGQLPKDISASESELTVAKRIAREVLMSSRHYLAVSESEESFAGGKLWTWHLKPLGFALRFYHYHETGNYVPNITDLKLLYPILGLNPVVDYQQIIEDGIVQCEAIMST